MIGKVRKVAGMLLAVGLSLAVAMPCAAVKKEKYEALPLKYNGSMMPYDFSRCDKNVAWGDTLTPVFLSYTARHGSRYLSSAKKIEKIRKSLATAEKKGQLTEHGKAFYALLKKISEISEGKWGLLSQVGVEEEFQLGSDMAAMLPGLMKKGVVKSISTSVPRVIMTMDQFVHALEIPNQNLELYTGSGKQFDPLLCCFIADTVYAQYRKKGNWKEDYERYVDTHVSAGPAARLFKKGYIKDEGKLRRLSIEMYGMLQALSAFGEPQVTTEWMTEDEYHGCWLSSNLLHYFRNNVTPLSDAAGHASSPLLRRIMSDIDLGLSEMYKGDKERVKMAGYFGHAETLLPLLSLMRIPGCYDMSGDYENLDKVWKIEDITPLAANLAIVLLEGPSGTIYASVRLNGRNVSPVPGKGEVVRWADLQSYWHSLLK